MKSIIVAAAVSAFTLCVVSVAPPASAQTMAACEAKAVSKTTGKPLSGAAKTSSVNKCMKDYCESHAVSSTGKKLSGAAKTSFVKKCEQG